MALSEQQSETIKIFKKLNEIGAPMNRETLKEAHREAYPQLAGAEPRILAAYVTQNLNSIQFIAALGFECRKMELFVGREILKNLTATNVLFHKSADVYRESLKIAARLCFAGKSNRNIEKDEFADRTDDELEYHATNGEWHPPKRKSDAKTPLITAGI